MTTNHEQAVIFLDHDDSNVETNLDNQSSEDNDELETKKIKAASVIIKHLTSLRDKPAGGLSTRRIGMGITSYFSSDLGKNTTEHSTNKSNDSTGTTIPLPGIEQLEKLIARCEYECTQDPYRGIGWLWEGKQKDGAPMKDVAFAPRVGTCEVLPPPVAPPLLSSTVSSSITDVPASVTGKRDGPSRKNVSPWDACRWGILGDVRANHSPTTLQTQPENMMNEVTHSSDKFSVRLEPDNPENLVTCLTESCCPSLLAWTKQRIEQDAKTMAQQNRRRKMSRKRGRSEPDAGADSSSSSPPPPMSSLEVHLGHRPTNSNYRCQCDFNPFCLASSGGVMNDILTERCQSGTAIAIDNEDTHAVDDGARNDERISVKRPANVLRNWLGATKTTKSKESTDHTQEKLARTCHIVNIPEDSPDDSRRLVVVDAEVVEAPTGNGNSDKERTPNDVFDFAYGGAVSLSHGDGRTDGFDFMEKQKGTKKEWGVKHSPRTITSAPTRGTMDSLASLSQLPRTIITCKPLGTQHSNKPAPGEGEDPGDVYSNSEEDETINRFLNDAKYSRGTQEELDRLRTSQIMDVSRIQRYWQDILEHVQLNRCNFDENKEPLLSVNQYMQVIADWHKAILFLSPIKEDHVVASDKIKIGLPPGIQNLGATCYLNTQLQCLAQIPTFLDGIFSWRVVNNDHNMNPVMIKLQKLLAQMLVGGERKLTTQDFSDALGLEHHEQQDPNEFGRLLFDRMEESFQQCSGPGSSDGNCTSDGDLAYLLERIFRGTTMYETKCMKCGITSARSEDFTDLNLPIVRRPSEESMGSTNPAGNGEKSSEDARTTRRKKGTIDEAFRKNADTDVQYCFDKYATAEILDGDNQYHCNNCDSKQDAERVLSLTKLPPVLNVQLSRYVFDRVKLVKKKLMDKVLLPMTLAIGRQKIDNPSESRRLPNGRKYVLCAVMRHQGTSAYSGHYIAEAMDWTTGLWYEFNDETVKVLPHGPSCSYIPSNKGGVPCTSSDADGTENESRNFWNGSYDAYEGMIGGSQDAYNMYYVDECYLATNAVTTVTKRLKGILSDIQSESGILRNAIEERKTRYSFLSEMCFTDWQTSDRLRRRKLGIRKFMFRDPSSLRWHEDGKWNKNEEYFWIEGDAFRSFLECSANFDDRLRSLESLVCPESLLCAHGYLHPRRARCGKLLRKEVYDAYVSLLKAERQLLRDTSIDSAVSDVVGRVIEASSNLFCMECAESYRNDLAKKLDYVKAIKDLYFALEDEESGTTEKSQMYDHLTKEWCAEEQYAYVLSRSSTTLFKKKAAALVKSLALSGGGIFIDGSGSSSSAQLLCGLDNFNIESFHANVGASFSTLSREATKSQDSNDVEKKFNDNITCIHGNSNDNQNRRMVRYVPWKVWALVKKVYPDAIEHRKRRISDDVNRSKPVFDEEVCSLCQRERDVMKSLKSGIERWARETRDNPTLKHLLDGNRTVTREIALHNFVCAQSGCRLVHCEDISNWRKTVTSAAKACKRKLSGSDVLKACIENMAFPSYHAVVLEFERQPIERLLQSLRSLICHEHKLVIKGSIFQELDEYCSDNQDNKLSTNIVVLSDEEHSSYIWSLSELMTILNQDHFAADYNSTGNACTLHNDILDITRSCYHPTIIMRHESESSLNDSFVLLSLDGSSKEFSLEPGVCACVRCLKEFYPSHQQKRPEPEEYVDSVSEDSKEKKKGYVGRKMGLIASDPIVVESDNEDGTTNCHKLRVFEFNSESSLADATDSLRVTAGSSPTCEPETLGALFRRRSARKRKTRYPAGCILREDTIHISLDHNVAALRLLLYQKFEVPLAESMLYIVNLNNGEPLACELPISSNEKPLKEFVDRSQSKIFEDDRDPFENIFILYQKLEKDEMDLNATLLDSLIQVSNLDLSGQSRHSHGKRKRQSERGFQGTLLQSSSSVAGSNNLSQVAIDKDESTGDKDEPTGSKVEKRARSNTIEISEEEKDDRIQSEVATENKNEVSTDTSDESSIDKNVGENHHPSPDPESDEKPLPREPEHCVSLLKSVAKQNAEQSTDQIFSNLTHVVQNRSAEKRPTDRDFRDFAKNNRSWDGASHNHPNARCAELKRIAVESNKKQFNLDDQVGHGLCLNPADNEELARDNEESTEHRSAGLKKCATPVHTSEQVDKMNSIGELSARLQKVANIRDQEICWDAITWAIEQNLCSDEQQIIDCAYAKILSDQDEEERDGDVS